MSGYRSRRERALDPNRMLHLLLCLFAAGLIALGVLGLLAPA